jgi:hypothetical protein
VNVSDSFRLDVSWDVNLKQMQLTSNFSSIGHTDQSNYYANSTSNMWMQRTDCPATHFSMLGQYLSIWSDDTAGVEHVPRRLLDPPTMVMFLAAAISDSSAAEQDLV